MYSASFSLTAQLRNQQLHSLQCNVLRLCARKLAYNSFHTMYFCTLFAHFTLV